MRITSVCRFGSRNLQTVPDNRAGTCGVLVRRAIAKLATPKRASNKGGGRQHSSSSLEGKQFEKLVEELSTSFSRIPVAEIGNEIDRWIKKIVLTENLDRGALAQLDPTTATLVVRHSWSRRNVVRLPVGLELAKHAPFFDSSLMNGKALVFSKVGEIMPAFAEDRKTFKRYFPKSSVTIPLRIGGETVGALGFATVKKERSWSPRMVRRLRLVAEVFGGALERRRAVEENALLRHELAHVSRMAVMGELTASFAHQLSQPMAAILSNAEAIRGMVEAGPPDLDELLAAAADIVQDDLRATETIKGLRAFFRKEQVEKTLLEVNNLVGDVVRMVQSDALFRKVPLSLEVRDPLWVAGDRIQLQQALLNLVLNAFDAVSESDFREVSVGVRGDLEFATISIRDTGVGIESSLMSKIFEPFFTTKSGGMGMGLAIALSIVKTHGGEIGAVRNPDRGSTFRIRLPLAPRKTQPRMHAA